MGFSPSTAPIVCVGTAALDTIAVVPRLPDPDGRIEASTITTAGGGPAATAAVAIARLGVPVELSAVIGRDPAGDEVIAQLEAEGVGTRFIERRVGLATAQSMILVCEETSTRAIIARPAAAVPMIPAGFEWLHVDQAGYPALGQAPRPFRLSVDDGNPVPGFNPASVDLYVPTLSVLTSRFPGTPEESGQAARKAGAKSVVATDGANGAFIFNDDGRHHIPAFTVRAPSTLGAGDVFHGALLAAIALGRNLHEAVRSASACAAMSCRGLDGRSAIPTLEALDAALRNNAISEENEGANV